MSPICHPFHKMGKPNANSPLEILKPPAKFRPPENVPSIEFIKDNTRKTEPTATKQLLICVLYI